MSLKTKLVSIKTGTALKVIRLIFGLFFSATIISVLVFRFIPIPVSAIMIQDKLGTMLDGESFAINNKWVPYNRISNNIKITVIAAEDQKFPDHWGFDVKQITEAIEKNEQGNKLRGASTITQQTAKNLFCWKGRSFIRKGVEAYFTILIELLWSKERILEVYLNIVELGRGIYGVESASKNYFNKSASNINLMESALLTAILPNPRNRSVKSPSAYMQRRTSAIIKQVELLGGTSYLKRLDN